MRLPVIAAHGRKRHALCGDGGGSQIQERGKRERTTKQADSPKETPGAAYHAGTARERRTRYKEDV